MEKLFSGLGHRQDYSQEKMNSSPTGQNASSNSGKTSTHFCKLPYVGRFSKIAQTKLRQLLKRYCKADLDVKLSLVRLN